MRPLQVVEASEDRYNEAVRAARDRGYEVVEGFDAPGFVDPAEHVVRVGPVEDEATAQQVVLAAVRGAGVIVHIRVPRMVADRMCEDLRRLGQLDHIITEDSGSALGADERAILSGLMGGLSLGETARALQLSRRTADRRLASARRALGVASTAEALVAARRLGIEPGIGPPASGPTG